MDGQRAAKACLLRVGRQGTTRTEGRGEGREDARGATTKGPTFIAARGETNDSVGKKNGGLTVRLLSISHGDTTIYCG